MAISAVSNGPVQQAALAQSKQAERVEGSQPDGDGDRDDQVSVNTVSQATATLGNNIDLRA